MGVGHEARRPVRRCEHNRRRQHQSGGEGLEAQQVERMRALNCAIVGAATVPVRAGAALPSCERAEHS